MDGGEAKQSQLGYIQHDAASKQKLLEKQARESTKDRSWNSNSVEPSNKVPSDKDSGAATKQSLFSGTGLAESFLRFPASSITTSTH
jgi:hypothetical protein